jgi:hypothetical protein
MEGGMSAHGRPEALMPQREARSHLLRVNGRSPEALMPQREARRMFQ